MKLKWWGNSDDSRRSPPPRAATLGGRREMRPTSRTPHPDQFVGSPNSGNFYDYIATRVPIISAGVWTWTKLTATRHSLEWHGSPEAIALGQEAQIALDQRIFEADFEKGAGLDHLLNIFFWSLFCRGRFACEVVPFPSGRGIDYVALIDPFSVEFVRKSGRLTAVQRTDDGRVIDLPRGRFFYAGLDPRGNAPGGTSPLDAIPWVLEIKETMLEDMARASHNTGFPRLHIKVTPPDRGSNESDKAYQVRANSYFDQTKNLFTSVAVDENLVTWNDIGIEIVGERQAPFGWEVNNKAVVEEVLAALHLPPWAVGYTHSSTKNWVASQFDLMMSQADTVQRRGKRFAEWIRNTDLALTGIPARVEHHFTRLRDPSRLAGTQADGVQIDNVLNKVRSGIIGIDTAARELGYNSAYDPEKSQSGLVT